jgi:hypothetical protein
MDADYLKLETARTMTTLRFLAANISQEEALKLRRALEEQVKFIHHRISREQISLQKSGDAGSIPTEACASLTN